MKRTVNMLYLCGIIAICGLLNASVSKQCYGEDIKPKKYLKKEYTSPEGNIIVRLLGGHPQDNSGDIWLFSAKNPSDRELLYSYERDASVLISPDEKWLVINDRSGTTDTDPLLYKRVKGLKYEEIENLYMKAWELFEKTHKKYKTHVFKRYKRNTILLYGHSYAEAVRWSSDSKSVLIEIYGHHDETPERLEPWYCIYDLTTGKMTLDFNRVFNRDTFHLNGEAKGRELLIST
ncbi:MAG: hypothetical protein HQK99_14635 [Nitrospirae bacterium]|nr:hypothetical protein [Nitrospirota bacterium]